MQVLKWRKQKFKIAGFVQCNLSKSGREKTNMLTGKNEVLEERKITYKSWQDHPKFKENTDP